MNQEEGMALNKHQIRSQRTREAIIDAAEPLFAPHGKAGVSLRGIAKEAGVDLSLVSYHFESKDALYKSVVDRIMAEFAERRNEALDRLEQVNPAPSALELFDIQIDAWLDIAFSKPAHRAQLIFNRFHKSEDANRDFWPSDDFVRRFLKAMERALPDKDPAFVHWTYHALMGAMVYTLSNRDRVDRISGMYCDVNSKDWLRKMFRQNASLILSPQEERN